MLIQYARNKYGEKTGVVVADLVNDEIKVGYSLCNTSKDRFNKNFGLKIAQGRLLCNRPIKIPPTILPLVEHVKDRAHRYFRHVVV